MFLLRHPVISWKKWFGKKNAEEKEEELRKSVFRSSEVKVGVEGEGDLGRMSLWLPWKCFRGKEKIKIPNIILANSRNWERNVALPVPFKMAQTGGTKSKCAQNKSFRNLIGRQLMNVKQQTKKEKRRIRRNSYRQKIIKSKMFGKQLSTSAIHCFLERCVLHQEGWVYFECFSFGKRMTQEKTLDTPPP